MNLVRPALLFILLLGLGFNSGLLAEDAAPLLRPETPRHMLALLPPAPAHWKLVSSRAYEQLSPLQSPETWAIRKYTLVPPPAPEGTPQPGIPPKEIQVAVIDTAGDPARFGTFQQGAAPPVSGKDPSHAPKYFSVGDRPAVQVETGTRLILQVAISSRFLLILQLENGDSGALSLWTELANVPGLVAASSRVPDEPLPSSIYLVENIDEMSARPVTPSQICYATPQDRAANSRGR